MTGPIVASPTPDVEQPDPSRRLRLVGDVHPLPAEPVLPSAAELHRAAALAGLRSGNGVPSGVDPGPTDAADVLDWLVGPIAEIRAELVGKRAGGFLVTAADQQRRAEVLALVEQIGRILAERA